MASVAFCKPHSSVRAIRWRILNAIQLDTANATAMAATFSASDTAPAWVRRRRVSPSPSLMIVAATTAVNTKADMKRELRSSPSAMPGASLRNTMPSATGITVSAKITTPVDTMPTCGASGPMNSASATIKTSGTVTTDASDVIAVKETDNATSPRAIWVSRLDVVPPGQAANNTTPTFTIGGIGRNATSAMAIKGSEMNCSAVPTRNALGWSAMRLKSAGVSPTPRVNMIKARASGSRTCANRVSMPTP
jgi:hypothetical protein